MTAHTPNYRPAVGQTLLMAYMDEQPYAAKVSGYHHDARFSSEQIEFTTCNDGKPRTSSLNLLRFYPDAPIDSEYFFCVVQSSFDGRELIEVEEAYFFSAAAAFDHKAGMESGSIKSRLDEHFPDRNFRVQVEKL